MTESDWRAFLISLAANVVLFIAVLILFHGRKLA